MLLARLGRRPAITRLSLNLNVNLTRNSSLVSLMPPRKKLSGPALATSTAVEPSFTAVSKRTMRKRKASASPVPSVVATEATSTTVAVAQSFDDASSDLSDAPEERDVPPLPPPAKKRRVRKAKTVNDAAVDGVEVKPKPKRKSKAVAPEADADAADMEVVAEEKPKPKRSRKAKATAPGADEPVAGVEASVEVVEDSKSKPKRARKAKAKATASDEAVAEGETNADDSKPKPKRARKVKVAAAADELEGDAEFDGEGEGEGEGDAKPKKKRAARKPKEPIVYDIPDVERKETTFKGRLGYACLNTVLRSIKPAHESIFASRTCRIDTIEKNGMEFVKDLGLKNVADLKKMIEWNEENNIRFMRMSSEIFPFASHPKYGYDLSYADAQLKEIGALAKKLNHRLTLHPGQFTQLGSPTKKVIDSSVKELEYHCEMMDRMGLGADGVMIIHMGGVYNDKAATIERFKVNYTTLLSESIKRRLVLENDEICYNLDDIMPVCEELNIPIVVDYHHNWIYPSSRPLSVLIPIINLTWARKGIKPKQHLSSPRPGAVTIMERRAHSDRCTSLPPPEELPDDMDLMIEAKDKEQAVFELYRIYGLEDVKRENLRPPKKEEEMTTKTLGRKSNKNSKKKKAGAEDANGDTEMITTAADPDQAMVDPDGEPEADPQLEAELEEADDDTGDLGIPVEGESQR